MKEAADIEMKKPSGNTKMLRAMLVIGIISALLIVLAFELTLPRVQKLKAEALEKAIFKVLPGTVSTQAFGINTKGEFIEIENNDKPASTYYAGYNENEKLVGYAVEAAGQGYADIIRVLYGYNPNEQILIGFQVLESKETPGLGDKIEKEQRFLDNFKALDVSLSNEGQLKNKVVTVKQGKKQKAWEIDGITGATISSRAIGNIIGTSTMEVIPMLFNNHKMMDDIKSTQKQMDIHE
ncbi:MAG: FMN-binding protein [Eudoraea sp.]|uniref:FMN-binding protein n=1 Tax=Eudoraea sp. TaxID=1979955 RepID=UPI003C77B016